MAVSGASAAEISSVYTELDLKKCTIIAQPAAGEEGDWAEWRCPGYGGIPVRITEGDLRFTVAYGNEADRQCAARQTFNRFNSLGPKIEWRLKGGKPFATILRWYQSMDEETTNWLVVSKFNGIEACVIAYVDPAVAQSNAVARKVADEKAENFDCMTGMPEILSPQAIKVEDIANGGNCAAE